MKRDPATNHITFGIPTSQCQPFIWRNQSSNGNTIQLYRDSTELDLVSQPFFAVIDLSVEENTLNQHCQTLSLPDFDDIIGDYEMLLFHPDRTHALRNALRHVCGILSHEPSQINTLSMQQKIELEIPHLLLETLCFGQPQTRSASPEKRQRALKKAVDYIKVFSSTSITLDDLCQETQVNAPTLQYAFLNQYGLSPKAYLRTHRLNNVHKELLSSNPDDFQVSAIAYQSGFNHMGQFAADYHKLFAELPSATLTRSR